MVAQQVLGSHHSHAEIAGIAGRDSLVLPLEVEPHVVRFVGLVVAQPAGELAVGRPVGIRAHYVWRTGVRGAGHSTLEPTPANQPTMLNCQSSQQRLGWIKGCIFI